MSKLADIIATHERLQEQIRATSSEALIEYFAPIFDADPRVKAIVWDQYAPYFNDGEPCEFEIHGEHHLRGEVLDSPNGYLDTYGDDCADPYYAPVQKESRFGGHYTVCAPLDTALSDKAAEMINSLPLDFLKGVSEDGTIQVTRDAVTIVECKHD